jgi:membrane fusion protein (multidrug efflux system)
MSDTLKKVLAGAVLGALVMGLLMHAQGERERNQPAMAGAGPGGGAGRPAAAPSAGAPRPAAKPASGTGGPPAAGPPGAGARGPMTVTVVAVPVREERLSIDIEAVGNARANESVDITAKVSNLVTAVRFQEGQNVARGAVLIELDSQQARADLAIAEAALTESRSQFKRSRELYTTKVLSDSQLEQIEATLKANEARVASARAHLADTVIRAPFAGRVGLRRVSVGSLASPGTVITTLDDTSTIKLDFSVPETKVRAVRTGLAVSAVSAAYPGETFAGTVESIDSRVDPTTRSFTVRARVPNGSGHLKPGMFLTVRLARAATDVLLVPEHALVPEQGNVFVFVVADGKAEKRKVQTGSRQVGQVQVTDGLRAGELVVTEGTQKLRDGAAVRLLGPQTSSPSALAQSPEPRS